MTAKLAILVFMGGGLGALGRFSLSVLIPRAAQGFPWATLIANALGALLIGLLAGWLAERQGLRAFWIVGLLGGFTTFSAFSLETLTLLDRGSAGLALTYVLASLAIGLLACWLGLRIAGHA